MNSKISVENSIDILKIDATKDDIYAKSNFYLQRYSISNM